MPLFMCGLESQKSSVRKDGPQIPRQKWDLRHLPSTARRVGLFSINLQACQPTQSHYLPTMWRRPHPRWCLARDL